MKNKKQSIRKSDLQQIYKQVCNDWKIIISDLIFSQDGSVIEVENDLISKAYSQADNNQKKLIEKYFDIKSSNILSRIKTWENVLEEAGVEEEDVLPYSKPRTKKQQSINAFAKIQLISEVLNEEWIPDFTNTNQYKYYPYFEKKAHGWVLCSYGYCAYVSCSVGFGCLYKTSDLAIYAGTQFLDIYKDYLPE